MEKYWAACGLETNKQAYKALHHLANSKKQRRCGVVVRSSYSQQIPHILCSPKLYTRDKKCLLPPSSLHPMLPIVLIVFS